MNSGETMCTIDKDQIVQKIEWVTPLGKCTATLSEDGKNYTFKGLHGWVTETVLENLTLAECALAYCMCIGMIPPHADQPFKINR